MNLLKDPLRPVYFKYLSAAFGSAMITSVYSIVDMAMVGQYQGPDGTAALAVIAPIWNVIFSLGLLMGIGGSVLFSTVKGQRDAHPKDANAYFTVAVAGSVVLAAIVWLALLFCAFSVPTIHYFPLPKPIWCLLNGRCRFFCSTKCWQLFCVTTKIRFLPPSGCCPVGSLI